MIGADAHEAESESRREAKIGGDSEECDIVARVFPRKTENDRATLRLSQMQTIIETEDEFIRIRDAGSNAATETMKGTNPNVVMHRTQSQPDFLR